jgi:outer membrane protein assembly factor BamB
MLPPLVSKEHVILRPRTEDKPFEFMCFKAATGEFLWRMPESFPEGYRFLNETPILADGVLYYATTDGIVHAIDVPTGTFRWEMRVWKSEYAVHLVQDPVLWDGKLVAAIANEVVCIDTGADHRSDWLMVDGGPGRTRSAIRRQ